MMVMFNVNSFRGNCFAFIHDAGKSKVIIWVYSYVTILSVFIGKEALHYKMTHICGEGGAALENELRLVAKKAQQFKVTHIAW